MSRPTAVHGTPDGLGSDGAGQGVALLMIVIPLLLVGWLAIQMPTESK